MKDHISSLQEQVDSLFASLNELRNRQDAIAASSIYDPALSQETSRRLSSSGSHTLPPLRSPSQAQKRPSKSHGPRSSGYGFDVAKTTLQTIGVAQDLGTADGVVLGDQTPSTLPMPPGVVHPNKDILWAMDRAEAIRRCRVYEEEIGLMYPLFDIEKIIEHLNSLYTFLEAAARTGLMPLHMPGSDAIDDDDTILAKLLLALTLVLEGDGKREEAERIYDMVKPAINLKIVSSTDMNGVILVVVDVRCGQSFIFEAFMRPANNDRLCTTSTVTKRLRHGD